MGAVKKFIASLDVKALEVTLPDMTRKDILGLMDLANLTPEEYEAVRRTYVHKDATQVKSALAMNLSLSAFQQKLKTGKRKLVVAVRTSTH